MKIFFILSSFLLIFKNSNCQSYTYDIDNDNVHDFIEVSLLEDNKFSVTYILSSLPDKEFKTKSMSKGYQDSILSFKNGNLYINLSTNKNSSKYTYSYDVNSKDIVLIGFDSEYGDALGGENLSWNLNNGNYIETEFSIDTKTKKLIETKNLSFNIKPKYSYPLSSMDDETIQSMEEFIDNNSQRLNEKSKNIQTKQNNDKVVTQTPTKPKVASNPIYNKLILEYANLCSDFLKSYQYNKRNSPHLITSVYMAKWGDKIQGYMKKFAPLEQQGKLSEEQINIIKEIFTKLEVGMLVY